MATTRTPAIEVLRYPGTDPRDGTPIKIVEVKKVAVVIREVKEEAPKS